MAHLLGNIRLRYFDSNGDPLAGGKLYSYQAGTSTFLATYTDQTETTENTNPVILDANGEAAVWIGSNSYKFRLTNAEDTDLLTEDNISYLNDGAIVAAKLGASAVTTAKIADSAVTTAKIADEAITSAKFASGAVIAGIATGEIATAKLADSAVTTAKINDGAITQAKRAALGQQISSSSSGSFSTTNTSYVDVTNLSVSITTTGRPVFLALVNDSSTDGAFVSVTAGGFLALAKLIFVRGSTTISTHFFGLEATAGIIVYGAISQFVHVDMPSAGTYTYKVQISTNIGDQIELWNAKLIAFEL